MRYPASEKLEIICTVEASYLPVKRTLSMIGNRRKAGASKSAHNGRERPMANLTSVCHWDQICALLGISFAESRLVDVGIGRKKRSRY